MAPSAAVTAGRRSALETVRVPAITAATAAAAASGGTQPGQRRPGLARVARRGRLRAARPAGPWPWAMAGRNRARARASRCGPGGGGTATRARWRRFRLLTSSARLGGGCAPSTASCIAARSRCSKSFIGGALPPCSRVRFVLACGRLAQPGQAARDLALDGADAAPEEVRDLRLVHVIEVPQHQRGPLPRRQRGQGPEQEVPVVDLA